MTEPIDPIACARLVELLTEYLDDALPADVRARVDEHLAVCDGCRAYLDQVRVTIAAAGRLAPTPVPAATMDRLLALYRAATGGGSRASRDA